MNIPSIPTDNLYKFIAIFGLVIIIAGSYLYISMVKQYSLDTISLVKESGILKVRSDALSTRMNQLEGEIKIAIEQQDRELAERLLTELKNILEENNQIAISLKDVEGDVQKSENTGIFVDIARSGYYSSLGIGTYFIIYGFWFWYSKLQYYQDSIIKRKADNKDMKHKELLQILINIIAILVLIYFILKI